MGGGKPSLKISAPYFFGFSIEGVLKIFPQRMTVVFEQPLLKKIKVRRFVKMSLKVGPRGTE